MASSSRPWCTLGVLAACSLVACTDASRMFTGRWEATAPVDQAWLDGRPELAIGHFGAELTGVVFYQDDYGVVEQADCPCAFIDQDRLDLDREEVVFETEHCDQPILIWSLARFEDDDGDLFLVGRVGPSGVTPVDITLSLTDTFVPEDLRECEP
ncbi:MAG: hypothetical protein IT385_05355 [Deltaproteobacteria bacterium]|nr:hypothetical protein [Deltaproteobacteria bacterium]